MTYQIGIYHHANVIGGRIAPAMVWWLVRDQYGNVIRSYARDPMV
jgi:hypothetical protein